jgi:hypothetical protein
MFFSVFYSIPPSGTTWNYLEPLRKGFIAKMAYLAEFWLILQSDLVECDPQKIFDEMM